MKRFTESQWEKLEHQALIFKYQMAGLPIPAELVGVVGRKPPIRNRNPGGAGGLTARNGGAPNTLTSIPSIASATCPVAATVQEKPVETPNPSTGNPLSYGIQSRYLQGMRQEGDEYIFLSGTSGNERELGKESSLESSWQLRLTRSKSRNGPVMQTDYTQMNTLQNIGNAGMISVLPKQMQQQQQHGFFGSEFVSVETVKQEGQSLRPFFDEWPKTRDSWSDLEDDRSNQTPFSTNSAVDFDTNGFLGFLCNKFATPKW